MAISAQLSARSNPLAVPRTESPVKVLLADDHRMVRRNLRLLLDRERDLDVIGEAGDPFTALRLVKAHGPSIVLLDLRMPDGSSIELIGRLAREAPDTAIVVVTMEDSPAFVQRVLDAGATGYVLKHHADEELLPAIRLAHRRKKYVSPRIAARLETYRLGADTDRLTPRELEVLRLVSLGLTAGEVAGQLHRSRRTVESHIQHIQHKLGSTKRSDLVRYALRHHLICSSTPLGRTSVVLS